MKQTEKFKNLIWEGFKDSKGFDRINHNLLRIREIMGNSHPDFFQLSVDKQYRYCITIGLISLQTATKDLRSLSLTKDRSEVFEYSIDEGFKPPMVVDISTQVQLKNKLPQY